MFYPGGHGPLWDLAEDPCSIALIEAMVAAGKPVAAVCHAPWVLIEAGLVRDRRLTSWPSVQTDIVNAGGQWVDEPVVVDRNGSVLITSRQPEDLAAFAGAIIDEVREQ